MSRPRGGVAAWLRLLRLPNLLTVPGDPLAGYLLAAGATAQIGEPVIGAMLVSLLLYAAGLLMNDLMDVPTDVRERPWRPLPSQQVAMTTASTVALVCVVLALLLARSLGRAPLLAASALVAAICLYNLLLKRTWAGPWAMGLCRGASVLLGASLVEWSHPGALAGAAGVTIYIAAVTRIARREVQRAPGLVEAALPVLALLLTMGLLFQLGPAPGGGQGRIGMAYFLAVSLAGLAAWRMRVGGVREVPPMIGLLISVLLPFQSALCLASGASLPAMLAGLALLLLWPVNRLFARYIPCS